MKKIKILIADDHEMMRRGLRSFLTTQPGWIVCGEAADGHEAVQMSKIHRPDIVVMDITMPELNGLDATRQILKALPRTEVLIFTVHETEFLVRNVFEAGARGFVLKSEVGRHLVSAVEALERHQPFVSSCIAAEVLAGYVKSLHNDRIDSGGQITDRESHIVQLLAEGKSNKEVATKLGISVKTAETHRAAIMRKLRFHSVTDLVRYAVRNHLIEP